MRRKLIALFTAVMVLTGYSLPAFAEEIAEPESVITVDSDIAADSETTEENGDVMEGSDSEEDADTSADADAEATAAPDEDITGETVTDTAETTEETVETAVPETEEAETAEAAETTDAAAEDTEELLEEEQEFNTNLPAWVKSWDKVNGVLTLQGQLPDTYDKNSLAELLGLDIWDTDSVKKIVITSGTKAGTSAAYMFCYLNYLTEIEGLENLDTSNATDMSNMFMLCRSLRILDLSGFDTSKVTEMHTMFAYCSNLTTIKVSDKWTTAAVESSYDMFARCEKLRGGAGTVYNSYKTDASYAHIDGGASNPGYFSPGSFTYPAWVKSWDSSTGTLTIQGQLPDTSYNSSDPTSYVLSELAGIDCKEVKKIVITSGTKAGTSAEAMFHSYENLTEIQGLANLDTSTVTDMSDMFSDCSSLTSLDLSGFKTSNVTDMSRMFNGCSSLTSLDLSSFNTSNVTNMSYMFKGCSSLTSLDLSSFDTSNVTNMSYMFNGCSSLTSLDLSSFDTSKVTNMSSMFYNCKALTALDLTSFDTSDNIFMKDTFFGCTNLKTIWVSDKWKAGTASHYMGTFNGCTSLVGGNGTAYSEDHIESDYARIDKPGQPGYLTAKSNLPAKPTVVIYAAFGGRTVQLNCADTDAEIYYNFGSSNITTSCKHVKAGETIFLNEPMTGNKAAMYFKAYKNGKWSPLAKWGVLNVQIAKPIITPSGKASENNFKVYTQTKNSYIVYTLDGSIPVIYEGTNRPTVKNGKLIWSTSAVINVPKGKTVKAIAVRCGLVTSDVMIYTNNG